MEQVLHTPPSQETAVTLSSDSTAAETPSPEALPPSARDAMPTGLLSLAVAALIVYLLACIMPFMGGLQNIMGLVIIGIGLYEAWKLNKRVPLQITGPYAIATAPTPQE